MNKYSVAAAVGSILASAVASAAGPHDLYIGGASAQSAFFKADFTTQVCGNSAALVTTYQLTGPAAISNEAWRCTATGSTIGGIANGDTVTVHYNSELGTISGVAPLVYNTGIARRLYVNPDSANCVATTVATLRLCTVTTYDNKTETHTSPNGNSTLFQRPLAGGAATFDQFEIGVLDTQAKFWNQSQNWTDSSFNTAMGAQPSVAALNALPGAEVMNGQVFSVLANNAGPLAAGKTISARSLTAIYTGLYDVWGDVPEVGGGNTTPIKLCRREFGSGTGVATSIFLTGRECGVPGAPVVATETGLPGPGELTLITENNSTAAVRTCVAGNVGAIGVTSLSTNTAYITLNLDGVEPNAHNAATGLYPFAFETIVYNRAAASGASAAVQALAASMITNAKKITGLSGGQTESATKTTTATAGLAGNQFTVAGSRRVVYAVPGPGFNNTISSANATSNSQAVNALVYLGGDACKKPFSINDN